ncbi:MAG: ArsR family transcriptional regulator [Marinilabiliales bacterium]|nr:MAG: ArsR family transcriptional regulator [Marinilabiliales bacterium]
MAATKVSLFGKELQASAAMFKALGHPARLAILKYLAEIKTCISGDISDELPLSRTTVNQHLKELKKVGLISGTVDGVKTNYCLNTATVDLLEKTLSSFIEEIKTDPGIIKTENDCC